VLPVVAFILFWVVLGLTVFFIAVRGGPKGTGDTLQGQSPGARKVWGLAFVVIYIGFGVAIPVAFLHGNNANANSQVGAITLSSGEKKGRILFGEHCGVCHTLAAANAVGKVGPNLDTLRPPASLVLHTINNGCLQKPPTPTSPEACLGQGNMPAGVVEGTDAQQVSEFVARVAGKE
jgi:mono/diheme cytochrome c family protein